MILGTVYRSTGSWYKVVTAAKIINCRIKGKLRLDGIKSTNPVVVGDKVVVMEDPSFGENNGLIVEIKTMIKQNNLDNNKVNILKNSINVLASETFLLITVNNPPTSCAFIDRFLVTAEAYKVNSTLICFFISSL